jgi:anti-anti-sigma regulatory factor
MMERLLSTVVARGATFAILDLTAVDRIEPATAEHLLRMIHALNLLGTQGLLSGIGPSVARALIELGIDLSKVTSVSSLHAALRSCMKGTRVRAT